MKHYNSFCKLCKEQNSRVYHTGDGRGRGVSRTPLSKWIWAEVSFPGWVKGPDVRWNLWLIKPVRSEIKIGEVSRDCLLSWVTCCSVAQLCLTLCDPLDCSPPGFLVLHYLLEFAEKHVHWVGDAIQPSHPVIPFSSCLQSFPASGSFPMSQLFASGGQSIGTSASPSVFPMNIQDWFPLRLTGWISLLSKGLSRVFSNTTVQKHQFFSTQPSLWSNSHICTWLLEKP